MQLSAECMADHHRERKKKSDWKEEQRKAERGRETDLPLAVFSVRGERSGL